MGGYLRAALRELGLGVPVSLAGLLPALFRPALSLTALAVLLLAHPEPAFAKPMDPALSRLVRGGTCAGDGEPCLPDRAAYHKLVSQWGFALAPHAVSEARTTGLAGFAVSLSGAVTGIDEGADYWQRGTRGDGSAGENTDPDGLLQLYSFEVRKGFGLGIEAAGSIGIMPNTSMVSFGGDLRVALLEGMRHGGFRYLPDASIGVALREATGLGELSLRTLAVEGRLSRPLVASGFSITPWLGYQLLRIDGDSALVDLTPGIDPLAACGYLGTHLPGMPGAPEPDGSPEGGFDGSLVCEGSGEDDYANTVSFGEADVLRHRLLLGAAYRHEMLKVGLEVITDLVRPDAAQTDDTVRAALRCDADGRDCEPAPRQWTLVLQVGAVF